MLAKTLKTKEKKIIFENQKYAAIFKEQSI